MELKKIISRKINRKLSFSNGWSIDDERYNKLCDEVSDEIIKAVNKKLNKDGIGFKKDIKKFGFYSKPKAN